VVHRVYPAERAKVRKHAEAIRDLPDLTRHDPFDRILDASR
jgi:PIN domain nuclease of toxin-antitoxin system